MVQLRREGLSQHWISGEEVEEARKVSGDPPPFRRSLRRSRTCIAGGFRGAGFYERDVLGVDWVSRNSAFLAEFNHVHFQAVRQSGRAGLLLFQEVAQTMGKILRRTHTMSQ